MLLTAAVALMTTAVSTPLAGRAAAKLGLVDRPGPLKVQSRAVPYLGGTAVFAGIAAGSLAADVRLSFLVPLAAALALGMADDALDLSPWVRLAGEAVVGVVAAVAADAPHLGLGLVTVMAVVVLINAVNLLDGLDGLAAGTVLAGVAGLAALLGGDGRVLAVATAAACAGFLLHNRPPASIYLGDGGAYMLGTALALLAVLLWTDGASAERWVAPLLVAVPVTDTAVAVIRRWRAGRSLFAGDRGHTYDQLVDRGWSSGRAAAAVVATQAVLTIAAVSAAGAGVGVSAVVALSCAFALAAGLVVAGFLSSDYRRSMS